MFALPPLPATQRDAARWQDEEARLKSKVKAAEAETDALRNRFEGLELRLKATHAERGAAMKAVKEQQGEWADRESQLMARNKELYQEVEGLRSKLTQEVRSAPSRHPVWEHRVCMCCFCFCCCCFDVTLPSPLLLSSSPSTALRQRTTLLTVCSSHPFPRLVPPCLLPPTHPPTHPSTHTQFEARQNLSGQIAALQQQLATAQAATTAAQANAAQAASEHLAAMDSARRQAASHGTAVAEATATLRARVAALEAQRTEQAAALAQAQAAAAGAEQAAASAQAEVVAAESRHAASLQLRRRLGAYCRNVKAATSSVRTGLRALAEDVRDSVETTAADFGRLGESLVAAVGEAVAQRNRAVSDFQKETAERRRVFNLLQEARGNIRVCVPALLWGCMCMCMVIVHGDCGVVLGGYRASDGCFPCLFLLRFAPLFLLVVCRVLFVCMFCSVLQCVSPDCVRCIRYCRVRPLLAHELGKEETCVTTSENSYSEVAVECEGARGGAPTMKKFEFDHVFGPETTQEQVFAEVAPFVTSAMDGYHACIFAYGQTGSGKTHTMQGPSGDRGVYYRALHQLFKTAHERRGTHTFAIKVGGCAQCVSGCGSGCLVESRGSGRDVFCVCCVSCCIVLTSAAVACGVVFLPPPLLCLLCAVLANLVPATPGEHG